MATEWAVQARLMRRTGFGVSGAEVDAALPAGPTAYIQRILGADPAADPGVAKTPLPTFAPIAALPAKPTRQQMLDRNKLVAAQTATLTAWWVRRMVAVEQPFAEKLTFGWHNHFAASATKVRHAGWLAAQNTTLRRLGRGDFGELAKAMLTDAAMLFWLDGQQNTAGAANENLSREFMELFTLGHGDAYTEADVREGARALTGWKIHTDGSTYLRARDHDNGSKTVLGVTGNLDYEGFLDAVLRQAGVGRFLATRWWSQLGSDTPPESGLVDRLAAAYEPNRSLTALFTAMLSAPEFAAAQGSIVVGPVEWLIGAVRAVKMPVTTDAAARKLVSTLRSLGQLPFYPPNVSGWPSGQAWLSSATAQLRLQTAAVVVKGGDISAVTDAAAASRPDAASHLLGIESWSARSLVVLRAAQANPAQLVVLALNTPEYLTN
jgi:uncharacterized protein (DUF1800 family)